MQLIKDISSDLKKLDKYFSGTTIFAFFNDQSSSAASFAFPKRLALYLKDVELSKTTFKGFLASSIGDSSLLNWYRLPEISA